MIREIARKIARLSPLRPVHFWRPSCSSTRQRPSCRRTLPTIACETSNAECAWSPSAHERRRSQARNTDWTGDDAMNQADTAWMLIATALVLLMTPALAFFYGGLVRSKNALNTMMMSFISLGFVGVLWAVLGYSLALSPGGSNYLGDLSLAFLNGVGLTEKGAVVPLTIPHMLYMAFQGTFCIITAAL